MGSLLGVILGFVLIGIAVYKRKEYEALVLGRQEFILLVLIGVLILLINIVGLAVSTVGLDSYFYLIFFALELITIALFLRVVFLNRKDRSEH